MAIRKRKTKTGVTAEYHYEFMQNKKRYFGVCEGCTTERSAREYEKRVKEQVKELAEQKSARKLVENFRDQLAGGGAILLKDGYREAQQKPRKHIPSPPRNQLKNAHWNDFVSFMAATYPEITRLSQVTRKHAEDYISFLRTKGRYNTRIVYTRGSKEIVSNSDGPLANATLIDYQTTLTEVFTLLHEDAGIIDNPFAGIPKPPRNSETREAFTEEELKVIGENLDSFTKPLFYMATTTALREGDICTLLWSEVNFQENVISRARMNKTGRPVEEIIAEENRRREKEAARAARKAKRQHENEEEEIIEEYMEPGHYKVKTVRTVAQGGSSYITGRKAEAEKKAAIEAKIKASKAKGSKGKGKKKKK